MEAKQRYSKYEVLKKIGEGTYGMVYIGMDKVTHRKVAIKDIILEDGGTGIPSTAIREISLLKKLKHPNIVELIEVIHFSKRLIMVFEYLDYDLRQYMKMRKCELMPGEIKVRKVVMIVGDYIPDVEGSRTLSYQ